MTFKIKTAIAIALTTTALAGNASAATIEVTVTNLQGAGGLSATPLYTAFHNGNFDAFSEGAAASAGVELIAETGNASVVAQERLAVDPSSSGSVIASSDGPPPLQPGETETRQFELTPDAAVYFTFLSMLLPSNDTFIGNDDHRAFQVFNDDGSFSGPLSITVTGEDFYDAGTEANDAGVNGGAAFVAGRDITQGGTDSGLITRATSLADFAGLELATGDFLGSADLIDFGTNPSAFNFLQIDIRQVAAVPLPAGLPLLAAGLGAFGLLRRRPAKT